MTMKHVRKSYEAASETTEVGHPLSTSVAAPTRLGAGSWIILIVLLSLLVATAFIVHLGWTLGDGIEVTTAGYVAMAAGVILSLAVGCGLMALVFYGSRSGFDEPPVSIGPDSAPARREPPPRV
jgi:hypothetical protein